MKASTSTTRLFAMTFVMSVAAHLGWGADAAMVTDLDKSVGQPVDIAPSAYLYRADRKADDNQPESWLALMRYANQPLNKPADVNAPAIREVLCGLLWEEIRPVRQLELTWASDATRQPTPEELTVTTLNNQGASSSWWNNLTAAKSSVKPAVSRDGKSYVYPMGVDTCGIVVGVAGKNAAEYAVPTARALLSSERGCPHRCPPHEPQKGLLIIRTLQGEVHGFNGRAFGWEKSHPQQRGIATLHPTSKNLKLEP